METTYNFDPEDWAMFQRSLFLLHSPDIDSERKLHHLLKKSIRKHHPTSKGKSKNLVFDSAEYSASSKTESTTSEHPCSVIERDPRLNKSPNKVIKYEVSHSVDAKIPHDNLNALLDPGSSGAGQQIKEMCLDSCHSSKTTTVRPISGIENLINSTQKKRLAHTPSKELSSNGKFPVKPYLKNMLRYSYCPSPVNLKKIRAVLARGDPFPTHLTKVCMNNITPDLQREKL